MDSLSRDKLFGCVHPFRVFPAGEPAEFGPRRNSAYLYDLGGKQHRLNLPGDWVPTGSFTSNLILDEYAGILCELLRGAPDKRPYNLAAMYIEYENNGGVEVSPPSNTDPTVGRAYYDSLLTSATRNYLRVPLTAVIMESTDSVKFPNGNKVTCFAQTDSSAPVYSDPNRIFSDSMQSRIYGGALIVTPKFSDATQDRIFSRFYFDDPVKQLSKLVGSQVGLKWPIQFA
jgi:hypothetical protein